MDQDIITTYQLGFKLKSKNKVYQPMATQSKVYMPPIKFSNHKYVSGIIEDNIKVS